MDRYVLLDSGPLGLADGAKDNWTYLYGLTDVQVVDFYHVTTSLWSVAEGFGRHRGGMQGSGEAAIVRFRDALEGARRGDGPGGSLPDVHSGALDAVLGSNRP